jgi:beta-glucosidase
VTNTGNRSGADVPQLYVRTNGSKRLAGWAKVDLKPGETREVTITAEPRVIATYEPDKNIYAISPGSYTVELGESAIDIAASAPATMAPQFLSP